VSIPIEIIRSPRRRKTVTLEFVDGHLRVRVPVHTTDATIQRILKQHQRQIEQWQARDRERQAQPPWYQRPFPVFGIDRKLCFEPGRSWSVALQGDCMTITGPGQSLADPAARHALVSWLRQLAQDDLTTRVAAWANRIQVTYHAVRIRDQKSRWGSCSSKGSLNFNWRLVMAPPFVIDSVVVHELCHRLEMNHSRAFWQHVYRFFPETQNAREWLKKHGQNLYF
jgi:predicted metal-dependent hydrolase